MARRKLWDCLAAISNSLTSDPWVVLGDLNVVRFPGERQGGNLSWAPHLDELNECCLRAGLEDLRYSRIYLTWSKGEGVGFKARKLDRTLINQDWSSFFPGAEAIFHTPSPSEHSPMVVQTGVNLHQRRPPFRFFNFWADDPKFLEIVTQVWATHFEGNPMFTLR